MKSIFVLLMLLVLMAACATTENGKSDPQVSYGGTVRTRTTVSGGK